MQSIDGWRAVEKQWLISIDFGTTEVQALEYLRDLPNSEVRIPDARQVLDSALFPDRPFHPKTFILDSDRKAASEYLYRKTTVPKANGFLIYKTMYLSPFPVPVPQDSDEKQLADRVSVLARDIQQSNDEIAALENNFETHLMSSLPITSSGTNFFRDYYSVPEYWKGRRLIPEQALEIRDAVAAIRIDNEVEDTPAGPSETGNLILSYCPQRTGSWRPLIELRPSDGDLRLFLLLALRSFLRQNARKQSWMLKGIKNSRTVEVVLNSLVVPAWGLPYGSKGFETNMAKVRELIQVFRQDTKGESNPSVIESRREGKDREIDAAFYKLYKLSEQERDLVASTVIR